MKIKYIDNRFTSSVLKLLDQAIVIIDDYREQGFVLTVRQLYYQLVARGIIANNLKEYKRVASMLNNARLAGLVDWNAIEDRTRSFVRRPSWVSGGSLLKACADQFHMDMWEDQPMRVFVLVEKEALTGVLEGVCRTYDVPLLAARGYPSASVIHEFVLDDVAPAVASGQEVMILHLGDHDPSGIDMTRDLRERINLFVGDDHSNMVDLRRIALNMPQVNKYKPPENPAKSTDSRFASYRKKFGTSSWELDALSPAVLAALITKHVSEVIDQGAWDDRKEQIETIRKRLVTVANNFDKVKK